MGCWRRWRCRSSACRRCSSSALLSATLLPLGSEPAVFGLVKLNPELFWPAVLVATAGNTARWCHQLVDGLRCRARLRAREAPTADRGARHAWLQKFGPKACLLSWLPGWATRCARWPAGCAAVLALRGLHGVGKFARYVTMTALLLWVFPGQFDRVDTDNAPAACLATMRP
jgi:membrane protein YqaA with SNARE-associated domain